MRGEDVDRLAADRSGRAEERDAARGPRRAGPVSGRGRGHTGSRPGAANRNESTRSSIPPWPGISVAGVLRAGGPLDASTRRGRRPGRPAPSSGPEHEARRAASWPSAPEQDRDDHRRRDDAADEPLDRLGRRDVGQELRPPEALADEVGAGVVRPDRRGRAAGSSRARRRARRAARRRARPGPTMPSRTTNASSDDVERAEDRRDPRRRPSRGSTLRERRRPRRGRCRPRRAAGRSPSRTCREGRVEDDGDRERRCRAPANGG